MNNTNIVLENEFYRLDERNRSFMKLDNDELQRRSDVVSVKLRKVLRIKQLLIKRGIDSIEESVTSGDFQTLGLISNYSSFVESEKLKSLCDLLRLIQEENNLLPCFKELKRILGISDENNYSKYLTLQSLEILAKYLDLSYSDAISSPSALIIINLTKGDHSITEYLVSNNIINILLGAISKSKPITSEFVFYALSNIIGDYQEYKNILIEEYSLHKFLLGYVDHSLQNSNIGMLVGILYCYINLSKDTAEIEVLETIWNVAIRLLDNTDPTVMENIL